MNSALRVALGCSLALLVAAATACSSPTSAGAGSPKPPAVSSPSPAASVDPHFDSGLNISITTAGFQPHWLVAPFRGTITWHNDTHRAQVIVFDHQAVRSGVIPPGGTFAYTPMVPISITYHSTLGRHGVIQVQT